MVCCLKVRAATPIPSHVLIVHHISSPCSLFLDPSLRYFRPEQTIILFDWDDTLCPSNWIREVRFRVEFGTIILNLVTQTCFKPVCVCEPMFWRDQTCACVHLSTTSLQPSCMAPELIFGIGLRMQHCNYREQHSHVSMLTLAESTGLEFLQTLSSRREVLPSLSY